LVDQNHEKFSIRRQCELLWIKAGVSEAEAFSTGFHQRLWKRGLGGKKHANSSHRSAPTSAAAVNAGKLIKDPPPAMEFTSPATMEASVAGQRSGSGGCRPSVLGWQRLAFHVVVALPHL
jgi:hypothetical protein